MVQHWMKECCNKSMNMKTRFQYLLMPVLLCLFSLITLNSYAQKNGRGAKKTESVQPLLEAKRYVFVAQSVTPSRSAIRQLTTEYDLRISGDSLIAALPFFGRAYSAPINPQDNGIRFTSTSYSYELKQRKKKWEITFRPTDVTSVQHLFLTVFENGSASLQVISRDRETISFTGYVQKL
jgi:hypothetical protein